MPRCCSVVPFSASRLGNLAGAIAHDFNNLLLAVQGHAELITVLPQHSVDDPNDVVRHRAKTIIEGKGGTTGTEGLLNRV